MKRRQRNTSEKPDPRHTRGSVRTNGLLLAIGVALLSAGGLWFVARAPNKSSVDSVNPTDVGNAPTAETDLNGSDITLQLVDRNDPGRLAAELKLPAIQPLEAKRYSVQTPSGWLYPRDGRVVWIRADRADLFLPNRQQLPERGDFKGNVIVRLFEGPAGRKIDPDTEKPLLEAKSEHMAFDGAIGELQIPERLLVTGSGISYAGKNVRALFNDPEQRLELLTAESSEYLRYDPAKARETPSLWQPRTPRGEDLAKRAAPPPSKQSGPSLAQTEQTAPRRRETLYRVTAQQSVHASQGAREIESDALEVFARLIDNQSPIRSTAGAKSAFHQNRSSDQLLVRRVSMQQPEGSPLLPREQIPTASRASNDDPVEVVWKGPLEVRPLSAANELLASNDLAVRFSGAPKHVTFSDRGARVSGLGDSVTYLDTIREARISSSESGGVLLRAEKSGRVIATDARMDLQSGIAAFRGTGRFENIDSTDLAANADRSIAWSDSAELLFGLDAKGDPKNLLSAKFMGDVEARGGESVAKADLVAADFDPAFPDRPVLQRVNLRGNAGATDAQGGTLMAKSVEIRFAAPSAIEKEPAAQVLLARGDVEASSNGSTLRAQQLDAQLGTDLEGKTTATLVTAREQVQIEGKDGLRAGCDELAADVATQNAELAGEIVVLAKGDSSVSGRRMKLEGETSRLEVVGEGSFHHEGTNSAGIRQVASAKWSEGMTYEDSTGLLEASGSAVAEAMPDDRTRDTLTADRVRVQLTPGGERRASLEDLGNTSKPGDAGGQSQNAKRDIISVIAFGGADASLAKVESRRYESAVPMDGEGQMPKLERLLYLESREIQADNVGGTLSAPGGGRILIVDRREANSDKPENAARSPVDMGATGKGQTLFSWRDSMSMNRPTQTMKLNGDVRLTNERPVDRLITQLDCEHLTATLLEEARPTGADALSEGRGQLSRAIAEGNARLKSGTKELLGQIIDYDALAGTAMAGSDNGSMVTLIDQESPTPVSAKSILWDIAKGRVEVRSVSTVVAPR
ncbi:MAG: hypothetical protein KF691_07855 [Phycisphaeraceae bacterium]|nr:hypothetical protein [Phycisphaeraceae bacterium]